LFNFGLRVVKAALQTGVTEYESFGARQARY
jgi:hypothetical protein